MKTKNEFKPGDKLERIVEGRGAPAGHCYTVVKGHFMSGGAGDDLIADGGYIRELITPERASEYRVISSEG